MTSLWIVLQVALLGRAELTHQPIFLPHCAWHSAQMPVCETGRHDRTGLFNQFRCPEVPSPRILCGAVVLLLDTTFLTSGGTLAVRCAQVEASNTNEAANCRLAVMRLLLFDNLTVLTPARNRSSPAQFLINGANAPAPAAWQASIDSSSIRSVQSHRS